MVTIARLYPGPSGFRDYVRRLERQAVELLRGALEGLYRLDGTYRQALHMRELDDAARADVGLTRQQINRAADRMLWRVGSQPHSRGRDPVAFHTPVSPFPFLHRLYLPSGFLHRSSL